MVADGFSSMEKRFDGVEARLDGVEGRLEEVEERLEGVEGRLQGVEGEVRATNQRIDRVVMPELDDHSRRIKDLEIRTT